MGCKVGQKLGRLLHTVFGKKYPGECSPDGQEVTIRLSQIWEGFIRAAGPEDLVEFRGPGRPSGRRRCEPRPKMEHWQGGGGLTAQGAGW